MNESPSTEAEYRLVTILFADLAGSTALGEALGAETLRLVLDRCLRRMTEVVDHYGGTVARLMGDGLLAFFGAPQAHEDDPERAARTALQIHQAVEAYAAELGHRLQVRIGVNTGRVVMGAVGDEVASEYTATGPPIHLAARLQSTTEPGTTLLGDATARLIRHRFETLGVGPLALHGFEEPVMAHQLIAERATPSPARGIAGLPSPLVGREEERAQLDGLITGLEAGRGALAALLGEPGIGKSRLLHEIKTAAADRPVQWLEGRAYSYSQDHPYGVVRDLLSELLDLAPDDTPALLDLKLERALAPLLSERLTQVWPYIATLIGAPIPAASQDTIAGVEGEALNRQISAAFVELVEAAAQRRPLVAAFEDLHWADPSSIDLIRSLFLSTERAPLLIVLVFRPDREQKAWELKTTAERDFGHRYLELALQPLDGAAVGELVDKLLAEHNLPADLRARIGEKSEGNPFFLEELVRSLIEAGTLARQGDSWVLTSPVAGLRVPETLQEVIQARLDRLTRPDRALLQTAAVIGRRFPFRLLEAIAPANGDLSSRLLNLQRADLVRERARIPEPEYTFKHTLVQEVAYNSLLQEQREDLHRRAGETMEGIFADRLDEYAAAIARHFRQAGDDERALRYHRRAADAAYMVYANQEAAEHYGMALEVALRSGADAEDLTSMYTARGRALELSGMYQEAAATYDAMREQAKALGVASMELKALMARSALHVTPTALFSKAEGSATAEAALRLARKLEDRPAEARVLWILMALSFFTGDPKRAVRFGERSLALARELGLREQEAYTLHDLTWSLFAVRGPNPANEMVRAAHAAWQELKNLPMLADSLSTQSALHYFSGELEQAVEVAQKAWDLSEEIDNLWNKSYSQMYVGLAHMERGDIDRALNSMNSSLELGEKAGFVVPQSFVRAALGLLYAGMGLAEEGLAHASEAVRRAQETIPFLLPDIQAVKAYVHLLRGDFVQADSFVELATARGNVGYNLDVPASTALVAAELQAADGQHEQAIQLIQKTIETWQRVGIRPNLPDAHLLLAEFLLVLDRRDEARDALRRGLEVAKAIGSRRRRWEILATLADLAADSGESEQARQYLAKAREIVDYIAARTGPDDLRAAFLAMPKVRRILDATES